MHFGCTACCRDCCQQVIPITIQTALAPYNAWCKAPISSSSSHMGHPMPACQPFTHIPYQCCSFYAFWKQIFLMQDRKTFKTSECNLSEIAAKICWGRGTQKLFNCSHNVLQWLLRHTSFSLLLLWPCNIVLSSSTLKATNSMRP